MVILKTANKTSNSVTLSKVCELDAIIWAGINLYNDPITEIEVDAVWNISEYYKKENEIQRMNRRPLGLIKHAELPSFFRKKKNNNGNLSLL